PFVARAPAVPQPPPRPAEAPPRAVAAAPQHTGPQPTGPQQPERAAKANHEARNGNRQSADDKNTDIKSTPDKPVAGKDAAATQPPSAKEPQRERTAALPPAQRPGGQTEPAGHAQEADKPAPPPGPSACRLRLTPDVATVQTLQDINEGECTATDVVRLEAVMDRDGRRVALAPPATLQCPMAEAIVRWIREDAAPTAVEFGAPLKSVIVDTSYDCRSRNHIAGAKLSEHGHAN